MDHLEKIKELEQALEDAQDYNKKLHEANERLKALLMETIEK